MLFTITVPACNIGPYAERMLQSLQEQTMRDFEVLLYYEESSDQTLAELETIVQQDKRFRLIRTPKSGSASAARNYGMENAAGDYLVFLDGDDWIEPDALENLAEAIRKSKADIIGAEYRNWQETPEGPVPCGGEKRDPHPGRSITTGPEALEEELCGGFFRSATWRNIYRTHFLRQHDLRQIPGRKHQDDEWTPRVFLEAESFFSSGVIYYNYRKRTESVTTRAVPDSIRDIARNTQSAFVFWKTHRFSPGLAAQLAHWHLFAIAKFFSAQWATRYSREDRKKEFLNLMRAKGALSAGVSMLKYAGKRDIVFFFFILLAVLIPWTFPLGESVQQRLYHGGKK